ncbi:hypothetical protein [Gimesia maris]|jgi:hypothetical protein|uniref:Uncharacterized protein n=1 Tax=Gimesia maris TaxID=122 RepID=A0A3D3R475_9PLAN|nr:hypothetical protein [Gimesia maris]MAC55868.1 hypothetical protein [Gimesia sp.]EDL62450.1 hypothetical protein PM8797T_29019 [Gimesia maris DSM 8797]QDT79563.1 hypothetical protein Mal35_30270 [Gimesia maris]QDU15198.1 hypothetical protein CA11_30180 [Gimesia maris]QEG17163.1 hypothetical protein GmarT_30410 [Gimesia maris]|tara:strand:- start:93689 stop:94147 length:459 start_codon:yes stop_codon:yes gene_type:complete
MKLFNEYGVSFEYPDDWELTKEVNEKNGEIQISVAAADSSFWMISLFLVDIPAEELLKKSLEVFQEEYEELDVYEAHVRLAGKECSGYDLEFVCSELINSAFLRVLKTSLFTAFILYQGTDQDLQNSLKDLEAISLSLDIFDNEFDGYLDIV